MEKINDGGPAFPVPMVRFDGGNFFNVRDTGMSLRDWFAGSASESDILRHQSKLRINNGCIYSPEECRYAYADAMLKARSANV